MRHTSFASNYLLKGKYKIAKKFWFKILKPGGLPYNFNMVTLGKMGKPYYTFKSKAFFTKRKLCDQEILFF